MLRIYPVLLKLVRSTFAVGTGNWNAAIPIWRDNVAERFAVRRSMLPRAVTTAAGNRKARYHTALGSLREALSCFETAAALGYLPEVEAQNSGSVSTMCSARSCVWSAGIDGPHRRPPAVATPQEDDRHAITAACSPRARG